MKKSLQGRISINDIDEETMERFAKQILWREETRADGSVKRVLNRDVITAYINGASAEQLINAHIRERSPGRYTLSIRLKAQSCYN